MPSGPGPVQLHGLHSGNKVLHPLKHVNVGVIQKEREDLLPVSEKYCGQRNFQHCLQRILLRAGERSCNDADQRAVGKHYEHDPADDVQDADESGKVRDHGIQRLRICTGTQCGFKIRAHDRFEHEIGKINQPAAERIKDDVQHKRSHPAYGPDQ